MVKERFKIIPSVYLVLMRGSQIFLSRRYNTGFCDGEYSFPAGHLDPNESLTQAMAREAKEEIGIGLNLEDLKLVHTMHRKETNDNRVDFFFTAKRYIGKPEIMEPDKCDDLKWFDINNLPDNIIPYIKQAINCFKNKNSYSEYGW